MGKVSPFTRARQVRLHGQGRSVYTDKAGPSARTRQVRLHGQGRSVYTDKAGPSARTRQVRLHGQGRSVCTDKSGPCPRHRSPPKYLTTEYSEFHRAIEQKSSLYSVPLCELCGFSSSLFSALCSLLFALCSLLPPKYLTTEYSELHRVIEQKSSLNSVPLCELCGFSSSLFSALCSLLFALCSLLPPKYLTTEYSEFHRAIEQKSSLYSVSLCELCGFSSSFLTSHCSFLSALCFRPNT